MKALLIITLLLSGLSARAQLLPDWQIKTLTKQLQDSTVTLKNARVRLAYYEQKFDELRTHADTQDRLVAQLSALPEAIYRLVDERDQKSCFLGFCWHKENRRLKREIRSLMEELKAHGDI